MGGGPGGGQSGRGWPARCSLSESKARTRSDSLRSPPRAARSAAGGYHHAACLRVPRRARHGHGRHGPGRRCAPERARAVRACADAHEFFLRTNFCAQLVAPRSPWRMIRKAPSTSFEIAPQNPCVPRAGGRVHWFSRPPRESRRRLGDRARADARLGGVIRRAVAGPAACAVLQNPGHCQRR